MLDHVVITIKWMDCGIDLQLSSTDTTGPKVKNDNISIDCVSDVVDSVSPYHVCTSTFRTPYIELGVPQVYIVVKLL
jgi:hypothetical protein